MPVHIYLLHFFGGVFFANALPHLIAGVSGKQFPTPFASPPFKGLSSPPVNVAWALANLALSYFLLTRAGFELWTWPDFAVCFAGFGVMAFLSARSAARLRQGQPIP